MSQPECPWVANQKKTNQSSWFWRWGKSEARPKMLTAAAPAPATAAPAAPPALAPASPVGSNATRETASPAVSNATSGGDSSGSFVHFQDLSLELILHILSFVADAPYENVETGQATSALTDTLPLVCRRFYKFAKSDLLWKMALQRAVQNDEVWRRAAVSHSSLHQIFDDTYSGNYRKLYKKLFKKEISFTGPVFIMGMDEETIPKFYNLYLFEPRYRLMVEQLLAQYQEWAKKAEAMAPQDIGPSPPMYFLHAHRGLGCRRFTSFSDQNETALLVQIVRCLGMPTGHYDVTLQVEAVVRIERFWVEPNTGHLFYATGRRIKYI